MMARWLRGLGLALWLAAALCLALLWPGGDRVLAVALALGLVALHLPFLLVEMVWMRLASRHDTVPPARWGALGRALALEAVAAPRVFLGRMAWGAQRWPDQAGADSANAEPAPNSLQGRTGVVFVHGFVCNRGLWNPWMERLTRSGTPFVAVNLEPVLGAIDDYAGTTDAAVRRLHAVTGRPPIVVAHSMGGLAVRRWLQGQAQARVRHVVTIGSPHHGTALAAWAFSRNTRQLRRGSPWLRALAEREAAAAPAGRAPYAAFTCFHGDCDNVVFPPSTAALPGADNRLLTGVGHVDMADHPAPWAELQRLLALADQDHAAPAAAGAGSAWPAGMAGATATR
jgi:hypothetical protein